MRCLLGSGGSVASGVAIRTGLLVGLSVASWGANSLIVYHFFGHPRAQECRGTYETGVLPCCTVPA